MKVQPKAHDTKRVLYRGLLLFERAGVMIMAALLCPTGALSQVREWTVYNTANSGLPDNRIAAISIDPQGNVWTGHSSDTGIGAGCAKFDGETWTAYNTGNSGLPHNNVMAFAFDQKGNVWIGTGSTHSTGGGLAKFDGTSWITYSRANSGLPNDNIWFLASGPEGSLWVGTAGGLAKMDGEEWTTYTTANSALPNNYVPSLTFDNQANLWVATWGGGVGKFNGQNWTVYNTANSGLPGNRIVGVAVDPKDNLWIGDFEGAYGNDGGLAKFDGSKWTIYNTQNSGLTANGIWALAVDGQGNVWAGPSTDNPPISGGLVKYDGKSWTLYNQSNSGLPDKSVFCLATDPQGRVWVGTSQGGLAVYRPVPHVDFNADGKVDIQDLLRMIESWGEDDPLVDIAPPPSGDGVVDEKDLELLMSYWAQEILDPALLAHWKLDEAEGAVAADSAGTNDGTLAGNPVWQPAGGRRQGALRLDGLDDCITTAFVRNPSVGPFSVFVWVQGGAPGQVILSQAGSANWLMAAASTGALTTELKPAGRAGKVLTSSAVITDGVWHRMGFVWDGSNRILYVDNVEVAKDTQPSLAASTSGLNVGAGTTLAPGTYWSGLIDDLRLYNQAVKP